MLDCCRRTLVQRVRHTGCAEFACVAAPRTSDHFNFQGTPYFVFTNKNLICYLNRNMLIESDRKLNFGWKSFNLNSSLWTINSRLINHSFLQFTIYLNFSRDRGMGATVTSDGGAFGGRTRKGMFGRLDRRTRSNSRSWCQRWITQTRTLFAA